MKDSTVQSFAAILAAAQLEANWKGNKTADKPVTQPKVKAAIKPVMPVQQVQPVQPVQPVQQATFPMQFSSFSSLKKPAVQPAAAAPVIQIIDYSPKAFAVIGDTKPIKDILGKQLRGRFNYNLTCGAGWIFPKTKLAEVKRVLKIA